MFDHRLIVASFRQPRATMRVVESLSLVDHGDIVDARSRLTGVAVTTPLDRSRALSDVAGGPCFVKCENLQRTGSFKIRGAYNLISRLTSPATDAGVVAASAGNHAQGVALAAALSGIRARVFMPEAAPIPKVEATKRYGADVVLTGHDFGAAYAAAVEFSDREGSFFVHPFDHPHIIAGQGTAGLEILEQFAAVDEGGDGPRTVVVPVGGGGLISGIAAALRGAGSGARVVGVQAAGAAAFPPSLQKGSIVRLEDMSTIADGIAANSPGELTFAHVRELVDDVVTVGDDAIAAALLFAAERMKLVLEPAGAAGLAAVLQRVGDIEPPVVVVLSGGNIDPLLLLRVIRFGMSASGRYFAFHTRIADRPGQLHRLIGLIAELGANIVGVEHRREGVRVHLGEVDVALQVETKGPDHIAAVVESLSSAGYTVEPL
ncbi:MAG TPA: threonine ammonia-lyase [Actinomycetota bacterium]|nr:threonine ammonia-lyase [Actinomycetota bacterium]